MTDAQRIIMNHINSRFILGSVRTELIGDKEVRVTDRKGDSMVLTVDGRGNIIDTATKEVYAFRS